MRHLSKKQNIKISIIITFITMICSMIVHFFYTPFLLNSVGDDQYGLYGFTTSILSWLSVAINAILSAYNKIVSEEIAKDEQEGEKRINSVYSLIVFAWVAIISIASSVLLLLMSFGVIKLEAYNQQDQQTIFILFIIVSIQTIITVATKVFNLNITYNNHHVWVKTSTLLVTVLPSLISIPFILNGCNIITIVIIQVSITVVSNIVDVFYDRFVLKKVFPIFPKKKDAKLLGPIFVFCSAISETSSCTEFSSTIVNFVAELFSSSFVAQENNKITDKDKIIFFKTFTIIKIPLSLHIIPKK